jgi:predicted phosphodiesterase
MRIAIFSDTHGNSIALDAVLADIAGCGGVDAHWFLGDAAPIGFDPVGTVQRLMTLPGMVAVHGNGDRRVATDPGEVRARFESLIASDPAGAAGWRSILAESRWVRDGLTAAGGYGWLAGLPLEQRQTLPDGTRVLLVHASPGTDQGSGVPVDAPDDTIAALLREADADLLLVGHTHRVVDRAVRAGRVVNPGSVSNPPGGGSTAHWVLLEATPAGYHLSHRTVEWDLDQMLAHLAVSGHPDPGHLLEFWPDPG